MHELVTIADRLTRRLARLTFGPPVTHVYNPLVYARAPYEQYVERYGQAPREILLLGMNPGPFGMTQTGVPFGEVSAVRDWLGIEAEVRRPRVEHPRRPIEGFSCRRSEVSGTRLWGWAREHFGTPARFFARMFVANYCPLVFVEESGRNRTPDKLAPEERQRLFSACDEALVAVARYFRPRFVIGIGAFAEGRARSALEGEGVVIGRIHHPSPASPLANRNWGGTVWQDLNRLGIQLDGKPGAAAGGTPARGRGGRHAINRARRWQGWPGREPGSGVPAGVAPERAGRPTPCLRAIPTAEPGAPRPRRSRVPRRRRERPPAASRVATKT
jgi:single-strand selective monofunctional uracil DNA glycosylase